MTGRIAALVAEDEAPQRAALIAALCEVWPELDIVECADGLSALEAFEERSPSVAFLDIRMPGISGIDVARAVGAKAQIVFTTAYSEYALKAFDEGAVDYLLKPITRERLAKTIERVKARLAGGGHDIVPALDAIRAGLQPDGRATLKWITANAGDTVKLFAVDDVLFFQAQDKYTRVVTAGDEAHIRTSLKELIAGLDSTVFWQVHRGAIVRAAAIDRVKRDTAGRLTLLVKGRSEALPVSAAFHHRFKAM